MQLEEIHYLTVEFQQWDDNRRAEESKKEEPVPEAKEEPKVDLDQIRREAAAEERKKL